MAILIQNDRFGTSMGESLRTHSDFMRIARRQEAEERAGKVASSWSSRFSSSFAVDADRRGRPWHFADLQIPVPDDGSDRGRLEKGEPNDDQS